MAGTVTTDLNAIALTTNAKTLAIAKGTDLNALISHAKLKAAELRVILAQIIALHPTGGGDAANLTSLNTILGELV